MLGRLTKIIAFTLPVILALLFVLMLLTACSKEPIINDTPLDMMPSQPQVSATI